MEHLILIGFMGCGKSTVGKALAKFTGLALFDTDKVIEQLRGQSIAELFAAEGEEAFRQYEHEILMELLNNPEPSIIVCGGGTPCFFNTMELLNQKATTIYLQTPIETLYQRLQRNVAKRPLLQDKPDLKKHIAELLAQRESTYKKAQFTINTEGKTVNQIVQEVGSCPGFYTK